MKTNVPSAIVILCLLGPTAMAATEVTASRQATFSQGDLTVVTGTIELPVAGWWTLATLPTRVK